MEPFLIGVILALAQGEAPSPTAPFPVIDDGWRSSTDSKPLTAKSRVEPGSKVVPAGGELPPFLPGAPLPGDGLGVLPSAPPPVLLPTPQPDGILMPGLPLARPRTEESGPKAVEIVAPLLPPEQPKPAEAAAAAAAAAAADRWWLMRCLQGTWPGVLLDDNRLYTYGWITSSYTASPNDISNSPVVWNDRANRFLMQQAWFRFGRAIDPNNKDVTFGFQADFLVGSDYRFTLARGLLNSQLMNADGVQNLYGVDPIQHYLAAYVPCLFKGTEFRAGRLYCPWGVESLESVSTPLISRSYAFNWCPPFTHCGVGAYITFNPVWSGVLMVGNGNDIYFGNAAEEWRFMGRLTWTQPNGGKNTVSFATSLGRGKFDEGKPFAPTTISLPFEPLGRNNFNAFDIVWTHSFNSRFAYNLEAIYAYQNNVPGIFNEQGYGTASWMSAAHYLFWNMAPNFSVITRFETFDDFVGQRTGFEGLYLAGTLGCTWKICKDLILRWEARYDYNIESTPFEGKPGLATTAMDLTIRW